MCLTVILELVYSIDFCLKHHRSYLKKLLFVDMLVAINVKHFEGDMKSRSRLCNSNTIMSFRESQLTLS